MTPSTWIFAALALGGFLLSLWSCVHNKNWGGPDDPCIPWVSTGPYRFMKDPMYWGNGLCIMGMAGLAAGWWNALAVGEVAYLVMKEWTLRERKNTEHIRRRHERMENDAA